MKKDTIRTERLATNHAPILSEREAKKRLPEEDRLYPTVKEERQYRELKEKYGL